MHEMIFLNNFLHSFETVLSHTSHICLLLTRRNDVYATKREK